MSKHTPGPWEIHPDDAYEIRNRLWGGIAHVDNEPAENEPLMVMARANARLIAAAPEQNETLIFIETLAADALAGGVDGRAYFQAIQERAHEAIAKATEGNS